MQWLSAANKCVEHINIHITQFYNISYFIYTYIFNVTPCEIYVKVMSFQLSELLLDTVVETHFINFVCVECMENHIAKLKIYECTLCILSAKLPA